ncbi:MAG: TPM domain-containing protein, partial [Chitinophagaceae bacterium]
MNKSLLAFFVLLILALPATAQKFAERPNPPRLVNDLTGKLLTGEQVSALEAKLVAYDDSTSNQIAIVIVDDLKGYSAADFAIGVGRDWGVGNKNFDNGIVVLISTGGGAGKRDAFIAPGYGLEGVITDLTADAIIDNELVPGLKTGNYYGGLNSTVDALIAAAAGKYKAPADYRKKKGNGVNPMVIIILAVVLISLFSRGGGGGGMVSRRGYTGWGGGFGGFGGGGFGGG